MSDDKAFFKGYVICVVQTKIGKTRKNLFEKNIVKFGGSTTNDYKENSITHFVVDEEIDYEKLKRITKLEVINKPILKCMWLSECIKKKSSEPIFSYQIAKVNENFDASDNDEKEEVVKDLSLGKFKKVDSSSTKEKNVDKPSTPEKVC